MTIRRQPSDFRVEERIEPAVAAGWTPERPDGLAAFAVYRLGKRSLATPQATSFLAKALGIKPGAVDHAGLKDKHAETVQHVSAAMPAGAGVPERGEQEGWWFEFVGWSSERASAAWIAGNRFEIVVRDLTRAASDEMEKAARALWIRGGTGVAPVSPKATGKVSGPTVTGGTPVPPSSVTGGTPVPPSSVTGGTPVPPSSVTGGTPVPPSSVTGGTPVPPSLAIVNYFGDQRFGSARHGEGFAARRLIDGDFDGALRLLLASPHRKDTGAWRDFTRMAASKWGKWKLLAKELPARQERGAIEVLAAGGPASEAFAALPYFLQEMCVDAYQSHLWNACVRGMVRGRRGGASGGAVIEREDDFGAMVFPASEGARAGLAGVQVPMPGPGTAFEEPWGSSMARVLRDEGVTVDRLRIPGLRRPAFTESWRDVLVEARGFEMSRPELDDMSTRGEGAAKRGMRTVRFELARGAYATVVLRALGQ